MSNKKNPLNKIWQLFRAQVKIYKISFFFPVHFSIAKSVPGLAKGWIFHQIHTGIHHT